MGYDVHITRASHWTTSASDPITLDEWKNYIASDCEKRLDGFADAPLRSGDVLPMEKALLARVTRDLPWG